MQAESLGEWGHFEYKNVGVLPNRECHFQDQSYASKVA